MSVVTKHAETRIKERLGVSKKISEKIADKALKNGISHRDCTGSLKKYVNKLYLSHRKGTNIKVYNRKVFIFREDLLITVLELPKKLIPIADKLKK